MHSDLNILFVTAASIGFFHTLLGPDHYLPFIVMGKARKWSYWKTLAVTFLCGVGHVASSVVLGIVGIALGLAVERLEIFESTRGNWAAWGLITFGFVYFVYGVRQAIRNKPHTHFHFHSNGERHVHEHNHHGEHTHVHSESALARPVPWALFVVFILGPCEPLIPILMYPAVQKSMTGMIAVAGVFSLVTISTMIGIVFCGTYGLNFLPFKRLERYSHALAGFVIFMCGCTIQFLVL